MHIIGTLIPPCCISRPHLTAVFSPLPPDADRSVLSWEPLIAVHTHRSDKLVYSVQRSPPGLNISHYDVRLVNCERLDCGSYRDVPGTERRGVRVRDWGVVVRGTREGSVGSGLAMRNLYQRLCSFNGRPFVPNMHPSILTNYLTELSQL